MREVALPLSLPFTHPPIHFPITIPQPPQVSRGGQGLTTYRELCNMANDMGKPELVYK